MEPAHRLRLVTILLVSTLAGTAVHAPRPGGAPAARAVYVDRAGVIRWRDGGQEVALFGANYALPSASDFRASGYVTRDRKRLIDEDMAHFARMGWDGLRLASWGDWESADRIGNLIANEHLDLLDYLIARARERGIYMLLTPIQTYDAGWPDNQGERPRRDDDGRAPEPVPDPGRRDVREPEPDPEILDIERCLAGLSRSPGLPGSPSTAQQCCRG